MLLVKRIYVLLILSIFAAEALGQQKLAAPSDQQVFNDETFTGATPISNGVLHAILPTKFVKSDVDKGTLTDSNVAKYFRCKDINLGIANERNLIVQESGSFTGADNDWFWIVRLLPRRPEVLLWVGRSVCM